MKKRICFAMNNKYLLGLLLFFSCPPAIFSQVANEGKITGKITNEEGEPLAGASIRVAGTTRSAMSGPEGLYTLTLAPGTYSLEVSFVSYAFQKLTGIKVKEGGATTLNVVMRADVKDMEGVVVTALGISRQQKALGYAAQQISGQSLTDAPTNNWLSALNGKVPGMNLQRTDGPTGSANIVLRGNKSFDLGNNAALIVVDGIIVSNKPSGNNGGANLAAESPVDFGSSVSDINPDDIESVTVLKGPGATALYGSRGAGGAIIITTKSGSNKKGLGITLNSSVTFDRINRWPDFQYEYGQGGAGGATYYSYGTSEDGPGTQGTSQAWGPRLNTGVEYYQYDPVTGTKGTTRTPWVAYPNNRKDLFRTGVTYNNSISLDGGNANTSVRLSINNLVNKWILPNTGYNRTTVNLSIQHKINEKIRINAKVNYNNKQSDNLPNLGYDNKTITYFLLGQAPNIDLDWYRNYWRKENETQNRPFSGLLENPFFALNEQLNPVKRNGAFGNMGFTYNITKELTLAAKTGINFYQDVSSSRQPKSSQRFINGMYKEQNVLEYEINSDFLLTYNKKITKNLKVVLSGGGNRMSFSYNRTRASINQMVIPGVYTLTNGVDRPVFEGYKEAKAINSLYGFANFSYKEFLFLDLTGRNDWSSSLPAHNNSYFYPSVNLSAVITDMFQLKSNTLNFAKLRLSYASVGSDTRGYKIDQYYSSNNFASSLTNPTARPNFNLKPEMTRSYEVGAEGRLFKNRVGFDVALYTSDTYNQILSVPVDESSGYYTAVLNAGLVKNKGAEVQLWGTPVSGKNWKWKVTGTWAANKGKIIRLADNVESFQVASGPGGVALIGVVGGEIGDIYGRGYVRSPDGDIVYENGLPLLGTEVARRGNANPDFKAGINNEITYKNWRFNMLWDGEFGSQKYSLIYSQYMGQGKLRSTIPGREEGGILGNGVVKTADGKYEPNEYVVKAVSSYYTQHYVRENTESNMLDASYIKLREVRLDYNINSAYLRKIGIKSAAVGLFGRDLFVITKWPIFDPETSTLNDGLIVQGFEVGQLPSTRSMGINVKVSF
jgi:TonB-linked SusC/RagA family outer membrane protein